MRLGPAFHLLDEGLDPLLELFALFGHRRYQSVLRGANLLIELLYSLTAGVALLKLAAFVPRSRNPKSKIENLRAALTLILSRREREIIALSRNRRRQRHNGACLLR